MQEQICDDDSEMYWTASGEPSDPSTPKIILAAKLGALIKLMDLAREEGSIHACDRKGDTALIHALKSGHAECAFFLVGEGADLEQKASSGELAIEMFKDVLHDHIRELGPFTPRPPEDKSIETFYKRPVSFPIMQLTQRLAERQDLHNLRHIAPHLDMMLAHFQKGMSAAVQFGSDEILTLLLSCNKTNDYTTKDWFNIFDLYQQSPDAITPDSALGISKCQSVLFNWLADANAIPFKRTSHGEKKTNALTFACKESFEQLALEMLARGARPDMLAPCDTSPLMIASESLSLAVVEKLIEAGFDIESRKTQETPLLAALRCDREDIANLLINKGANIEARNRNGTTPLIWSSTFESDSLLRRLLALGAQLDVVNNFGIGAIHAAVESNAIDCIKLLLEEGQDINWRGPEGCSPLHLASAESDRRSALELLIAMGAKLDLLNDDKETPLEYAIKHGNLDAAALLRSAQERIELRSELYSDQASITTDGPKRI